MTKGDSTLNIMSLFFRLPNCHFYDVTKFLLPNCHFFVVTNLSLPNCHFCELTKLSLPNCHYQIVTLPNCHYQIVITKLTLPKIRPSLHYFTQIGNNSNELKMKYSDIATYNWRIQFDASVFS